MTNFVESLARLFANNKITIEKLEVLLNKGKIKQDEYNYIVSQK